MLFKVIYCVNELRLLGPIKYVDFKFYIYNLKNDTLLLTGSEIFHTPGQTKTTSTMKLKSLRLTLQMIYDLIFEP